MTTLYALDFNDTEIAPSPKKPRVTEAEYWDKYYNAPDVTYEWNNGDLEEKAVSDQLTISMYKWYLELLEHYLRTNPIAESTLLEMGFTLTLPKKNEVRRPDLGVVLKDNPVPLLLTDKSYHGIYDMCVEAISDSSQQDIDRDIKGKKKEYAKGGVKEYHILDGHDRHLEFYRLTKRGVYARIKPTKDGIIKSKVLPGFQFRINDLLTRPSPDEMVNDKVYNKFVLPGYSEAIKQAIEEKLARQKAEQRALDAEQRALDAEQRALDAEQQVLEEKQRAHRLFEQMRALGINPDDI